MTFRYTIALVAATWIVTAWADDALTRAVDPYDAADQKIKFLKAAGNTNELDEKKFLADQKAGGNLVLPFEKWAVAVLFDKNKNSTLDWFEFEAYRQAMRAAVLAGFDKDKDGKLTDGERVEALKALAAGKVEIKPPVETPRGGVRPPAPMPPAGDVAAEAEATSQPATSQPASRPARGDRRAPAPGAAAGGRGMGGWQPSAEIIAKYDKDGDGQLNAEEMTAFRRDMMWDNMPDTMREFSLRNFDNADGRLTDAGWQEAEAHQREAGQMMQGWQSMIFDKDATPEQRRETMQKWAPVGMKMFTAMQQRAATAGGQEVLQKKMLAGMARYSGQFEKQAVADNGGKSDATSRAAMLKLIDADIRERVKKASVSGSGKLEPDEGEKLFMEIMDEFLKD